MHVWSRPSRAVRSFIVVGLFLMATIGIVPAALAQHSSQSSTPAPSAPPSPQQIFAALQTSSSFTVSGTLDLGSNYTAALNGTSMVIADNSSLKTGTLTTSPSSTLTINGTLIAAQSTTLGGTTILSGTIISPQTVVAPTGSLTGNGTIQGESHQRRNGITSGDLACERKLHSSLRFSSVGGP